MSRRVVRSVIAALGLACVLLSPASATDLSGVWRGKWTADATQKRASHGGPIRIRLRAKSSSTYQGTFSGRFAVVVPYFYRGTLHQSGNQLYATKRLGPFGEYRMVLQQSGGALSGRWSTSGHAGGISLRKK